MSGTRTVTLELLRQGPPHNQLLSPLTPYLALCGNHSSVTVRLPFEHYQLQLRLNALRYKDNPQTWRLTLQDIAQALANVLSEVPGLIADLSDSSGAEPELTHLRLRLSASELALVPFELASAPAGFPGTGQPLLLQAQAPLCITREVRRVGGPRFDWPTEPHILFAAGAGVETSLVDAHTLALRNALDPWLEKKPSGEAVMRDIKKRLVVVPRATAQSLQEICSRFRFTHIHVLTHGARLPDEEERYGLLLHKEGADQEGDVVDGSRLAQIFRTYRGDGSLSHPAVVTIAACEGGAQGSVVGIGASVSHTLHEAGVPLVVASQFPLTYAASVLLVEVLYSGLLWGQDPRVLLNDVRRRLKAQLPDTHDWASVVAYAALPEDFSAQLWSTQVEQTQNYVGSAVGYLNQITKQFLADRSARAGTGSAGNGPSQRESNKRMSERALKVIKKAKKRIQRLREAPAINRRQRGAVYQTLAMVYKWQAKVCYSGEIDLERARPNIDRHLRQACRYYRLSFRSYPGTIYALVQELSLATVINGPSICQERWWSEKWATARTLGEGRLDGHQLSRRRRRRRAFDESSDLIELYLLAMLFTSETEKSKWLASAKDLAQKLAERRDDFKETVAATIYQIKHYTNWFNRYNQDLSVLAKPASEIVAELGPGQ